VVLEVNERGKLFYRALKDIVERTYKCNFHLQYKNRSSDSKNHVICTLQEAFLEPWSMRPVRLAIEKTYNNKKQSYKRYNC
jgi:hypothetical protein